VEVFQLNRGKQLLSDLQATLYRLKMSDDELFQFDAWDPRWLRLQGVRRGSIAIGRRLDFSQIDVPWVKQMTKRWVWDLASSIDLAQEATRSAQILCEVMRERGYPDPLALTYADFEAVWFTVIGQSKSAARRNRLLTALDRSTRHAARLGIVSSLFTKGETTRGLSQKSQAKEDELGRGITEAEADRIEAAIDEMKITSPRTGLWTAEQKVLMFRTLFRLLRDTGRRPGEIVSLKRDCIQRIDGKPTLIYNNHKSQRMGRRLPIPESTAQAVEQWAQVRAQGGLIDNEYLFPPMSYGGRIPHVDGQWLTGRLKALGDHTGIKVIPYDFRHAYAQRHADAGVAVEVLAELMDHSTIDQTRAYYRVALDRKRTAIESVLPLTVGRGGRSADVTAYELGAIAVPFGNCSEPSNIKSGGHSCPIRFQCSGCAFYRTDPSYLPALEDHVATLRTQFAVFKANGSAQFIVDSLQAELSSYNELITEMREKIDQLDDQARADLEDAATILRRARGSSRKLSIVAVT
jgi:integrase